MRPGRRVGWKVGAAAALAVAGVVVWMRHDYAKWLSLGKGGLPATPRGWLTMTRFRTMARDGLDTRTLRAAGRSHEVRAWRAPRPRPGVRPAVSPYPIPHRQLDQLPDESVRVALAEMFDRTVDAHADRVEYVLSHFERRHPAITLKAPSGMVGGLAHGEIAHIHPSDRSMHMILSPADAVAAIENEWAQRHGLAGIALGLPETYVMVYAPRNACDLKVIAELLEAAIAYATQVSLG